jgi:hypothetical protein
MICIAALTHCLGVSSLTKSPLPYRFMARTGFGVAFGFGLGLALGGGDAESDGLDDAGSVAGVGDGSRTAMLGAGEPVAAATAPVGVDEITNADRPIVAAVRRATTTTARIEVERSDESIGWPNDGRRVRLAPRSCHSALGGRCMRSTRRFARVLVGEPGLEPGTSGI